MNTDRDEADETRALAATAEEGNSFLRAGAELFDAGSHHASHEVFEAAWLTARRGGRQAEAFWWQGLVLCAGALHHRGKGNQKGARALKQRALDRLDTALQLAEATSEARGWWVTPCKEWRSLWCSVRLSESEPQASGQAAVAEPRLGGLLHRHE